MIPDIDNKYSAEIGIIGGTGIYDTDIFRDRKDIKVYTPYGDASDLITIGNYSGKKLAFIARHGKAHRLPPHKINYRANIWALKKLGVTRIIAPSVVGSMRPEYRPGDLAIPDQFSDFTKRREYTFFDGGQICHISVADPFCPELRSLAIDSASKLNYGIHHKANYICIEGPRFSTRAESRFFRDFVGADIIGMTLVPECSLAREAQICYTSVAIITDYDVWANAPVSTKEIMETLTNSAQKAKKLIAQLIPLIPLKRSICECGNALEGSML